MRNIIIIITLFIVYLSILLMPVVSLFWTIVTWLLYQWQLKLKNKYEQEKALYFEINKMIKIIGMFSQTNDYNILKSLEESVKYLTGDLCQNTEKVIMDLKMNYDFEKSFMYLMNEYDDIVIFKNFIANLVIIKKQSNIENSAKTMFEISSNEIQREIIFQDKKNNIQKLQFKNFMINIILGYIVILIIVINMFSYYSEFAHSIVGILCNNLMILAILYVYYYLSKKIYQVRRI